MIARQMYSEKSKAEVCCDGQHYRHFWAMFTCYTGHFIETRIEELKASVSRIGQ